jgi:hypothetical protein
LEKIVFKDALHALKSKLQCVLLELSLQRKKIAAIVSLEGETAETRRAFYILSLMLLISFIFLAPDKIPQTFAFRQPDNVIFEKVREIAAIIKRSVSSLG